jgi:putative tryptophan/tyrosine transport system substrate-binding protein
MTAFGRRQFITLFGGAVTWPLAARTQPSDKLPTIGYLGSSTAVAQSQWVAAFVRRLSELPLGGGPLRCDTVSLG